MSVSLIMGHFASPQFVVEPALSTFKKYFPEATVILYTDNPSYPYPDTIDEIKVVTPPYDKSHKRYGWRASDLYRAIGMLECESDIAFYSDSDMSYCSDKVKTVLPLVKQYGVCLPANGRMLVRIDTLMGKDSDKQLDDSEGYGFAYNSSPAIFHTHSEAARKYLVFRS